MNTIILMSIGFIALEHFCFLVLEMFLWTKPLGRRVFHNTKEQANLTKSLAANLGLYNGFLSAGLVWGLMSTHFENDIFIFFLSCIVIAGIYGSLSVSRVIFFIQALPALVALILIFSS